MKSSVMKNVHDEKNLFAAAKLDQNAKLLLIVLCATAASSHTCVYKVYTAEGAEDPRAFVTC